MMALEGLFCAAVKPGQTSLVKPDSVDCAAQLHPCRYFTSENHHDRHNRNFGAPYWGAGFSATRTYIVSEFPTSEVLANSNQPKSSHFRSKQPKSSQTRQLHAQPNQAKCHRSRRTIQVASQLEPKSHSRRGNGRTGRRPKSKPKSTRTGRRRDHTLFTNYVR